jgi:hypothetical protein
MSEKLDEIEVREITDEEYETWQFEYSAELASEFLNDEVLNVLDEFEHENDDPTYIYGVATMGLFAEIIMRLGSMGYTEKELKKEVKRWINSSYGETLH